MIRAVAAWVLIALLAAGCAGPSMGIGRQGTEEAGPQSGAFECARFGEPGDAYNRSTWHNATLEGDPVGGFVVIRTASPSSNIHVEYSIEARYSEPDAWRVVVPAKPIHDGWEPAGVVRELDMRRAGGSHDSIHDRISLGGIGGLELTGVVIGLASEAGGIVDIRACVTFQAQAATHTEVEVRDAAFFHQAASSTAEGSRNALDLHVSPGWTHLRLDDRDGQGMAMQEVDVALPGLEPWRTTGPLVRHDAVGLAVPVREFGGVVEEGDAHASSSMIGSLSAGNWTGFFVVVDWPDWMGFPGRYSN